MRRYSSLLQGTGDLMMTEVFCLVTALGMESVDALADGCRKD